MPGQLLLKTPFTDILPASVREIPEFVAAAGTLDALLYIGDVEAGNVLIWSRIDGLEEPLLSNLAYQLHLEGYEGWQLAETVEQKRRLVKDAVKLHFYKGTRYTLERIFELLDMRGQIVEWWEAPEDPTFKPYEFDIDIDVSRPIGETFYYDVLNMVDTLKNVRSHRRRTRIFLTTSGKAPFMGAALISGMEITLRPFHLERVDIDNKVPRVAGMMQSVQATTLYPLESKHG